MAEPVPCRNEAGPEGLFLDGVQTRKGFPMDVLRILIAILLPPLGVFLQVGLGLQFWLNLLLTILGYIPGIIHAVYIIVKYK